ncbi:hypothetical protein M23134_07104 [Microscilla marina ATCC 23134]|uniref:Uncharacterized protein n=1 Tax=Microscilla marina ATCC 23134 TaxID=313606 RepID=A1ZUD7_MICM2|nr:hypothetical protein M23134_07104 [Microscilla marina ATCC 23134]
MGKIRCHVYFYRYTARQNNCNKAMKTSYLLPLVFMRSFTCQIPPQKNNKKQAKKR